MLHERLLTGDIRMRNIPAPNDMGPSEILNSMLASGDPHDKAASLAIDVELVIIECEREFGTCTENDLRE